MSGSDRDRALAEAAKLGLALWLADGLTAD